MYIVRGILYNFEIHVFLPIMLTVPYYTIGFSSVVIKLPIKSLLILVYAYRNTFSID